MWEVRNPQMAEDGETEWQGEVSSVNWIHRTGVNVIFFSQLVQ